MKTDDITNKFIPLINKSQKEKNLYFYYDNSNICQYYGQSNIEKCIFLLLFLLTYTTTILYYYSLLIKTILFYFIILTLIVDFISFIIYCYFLYKLKSDDIFEKIPNLIIKLNDFLIIFNYISKSLILVISSLTFTNWNLFILLIAKYILEIYFIFNSIKIFMFCPATRTFQENFEKIIFYLKYYILCFDLEQDQISEEYTRIEDIESFY
jgi:hypothetical protein